MRLPTLLFLALSAHSFPALAQMQMTIFSLRNPLPDSGRLECRVKGSPQHGYLMERQGSSREIKIQTISQDKIEETKIQGEMTGNPTVHLYIKHSSRYKNIVSYVEFHVRPEVSPSVLAHPGVVNFTTGLLQKDASGKETEELFPEASIELVCSRLQ